MKYNDKNFTTVGSVLKFLQKNSDKELEFNLDGDILHPTRFGTYYDPMSTPDQYVFMSKDAPSMMAGDLADYIQGKIGKSIEGETGGIEGIVHDMVHCAGMVSNSEREAHMALSFTCFQVNDELLTIKVTSEWWISSEAYFIYRSTDEGAAHIKDSYAKAVAISKETSALKP